MKPAQPADATNQVEAPGQLRIVDDSGQAVQLNRAELSSTGLVIAGNDWSLNGNGPLTATSTEVAPGSSFSFSGDGLERLSTVGIYVLSEPTWVASGIVGFDGTFQTSFAMPALEPGQHTLQINAVLADETPVSIGVGFALTGTAVPVKEGPEVAPQATTAAEFVTFKGNSTKLTAATRKKLRRLASTFSARDATGSVVAFSNAQETTASVRRAQRRADRINAYLQRAGLDGALSATTEPGSTAIQRRGAVIHLQDGGALTAAEDGDVSSLIVRLKKGRSPSVAGSVRGSDNVSSIGASLSVGPRLGLRMYRIDFAKPVSQTVAARVARELSRDPGIAFAEPDSIIAARSSVAS